ncbi:MAG TPA: nitroreductase/quinone reductase family protein [Acidimicrobiales bacterium]|nr:nitroreductase/quinone reductase family protein [Acidimicrobiales bacterium]
MFDGAYPGEFVTDRPQAPAVGRAGPFRALRRRAYRGGKPTRLVRVLNRAQGYLHSMGIWPSRLATLEVRGRRTGRLIAFPVVIADHGGERYLVAMLGDKADWVRNVAAAGGEAVLVHGRRERVRLEPVPVRDRPPVLRRYLECAPSARAHIPVDHGAPLEAFEAVAAGIPVFRIRSEPTLST